MFSFLARSQKPRVSSLSRRFRPGVECLEARDCPAAPQISLSVMGTSGRTVQLSGFVMEDHAASVTVSFSGVMTGSVTVSANHSFTFTAQASALGDVKAIGVDDQGLTSNIALANLTSVTPTVMLSTMQMGTQTTINGQVNAPDPGGLTVILTGTPIGSVTTNAQGFFSLTIDASTAAAITAMTTDEWGQNSNIAQANASTTAPTISNFTTGEYEGNVHTFHGHVNGPNLQGVTVTLGGMPTLANLGPVPLDGNGDFSVTVILSPGEGGTASASVTDANGIISAKARVMVLQTE